MAERLEAKAKRFGEEVKFKSGEDAAVHRGIRLGFQYAAEEARKMEKGGK